MIDITFLGSSPIDRLKTLMERLRDPKNGCPWDAEQSFETIAPYTIEEAYEVSDAIDQGDMAMLREELGDLMFQVIFHGQIAKEKGAFDLDDICDDLTRKMLPSRQSLGKIKKLWKEPEKPAENLKAFYRASRSLFPLLCAPKNFKNAQRGLVLTGQI
jgi:uncharacterized protein YabN with tetrapyrrole methylase and pyrophosphatase domain